MLDGFVSVPPAPSTGGYVHPESGDREGEIGGYVQPEGEVRGDPSDLANDNPDGFNGVYILETSWPNKMSYAAGFNVPWCSGNSGETELSFSFGPAETEEGKGGFLNP